MWRVNKPWRRCRQHQDERADVPAEGRHLQVPEVAANTSSYYNIEFSYISMHVRQCMTYYVSHFGTQSMTNLILALSYWICFLRCPVFLRWSITLHFGESFCHFCNYWWRTQSNVTTKAAENKCTLMHLVTLSQVMVDMFVLLGLSRVFKASHGCFQVSS